MKISLKKAREIRTVVNNALYDTRLFKILPMLGRDTATHAKVDFEVAQTGNIIVDKIIEVLEGK